MEVAGHAGCRGTDGRRDGRSIVAVCQTAAVPRRSAKNDPASSVGDVLDNLYSLDPDEFTGARNEAAKRLRTEGDKAGSELIKGLRKPTAAAWAVNQLSRRVPKQVDELLEAGGALRSAQRAALSGSGKALREATQRRRAAVAKLLDEASAVFRDAGRNPAPHVDAVRSSLEAASTDEATGDLVRSGRLTKEVEPPTGFGDASSVGEGRGCADGGPRVGPRGPAGGQSGDERGRPPRARTPNSPPPSRPSRQVRDGSRDACREVGRGVGPGAGRPERRVLSSFASDGVGDERGSIASPGPEATSGARTVGPDPPRSPVEGPSPQPAQPSVAGARPTSRGRDTRAGGPRSSPES